jgi:hypothetical protein
MKAITKAKRRVTLSICGLGWLDETEIESIPSAMPARVDIDTGEIMVVNPLAADVQFKPAALDERLVKRFHALGTELYGTGWDDKRGALVRGVTKKRTGSSKELTDDELRKLVEGMEAKLQEAAAAQPTLEEAATEPELLIA